MKILYFYKGERPALGLVSDRGVIDVEAALDEQLPETSTALIADQETWLPRLTDLLGQASTLDPSLLFQEDALELAPCVQNPQKIVCVGLNYHRHAQEAGMDTPSEPILFSKYNNALTASGKQVPLNKYGVEFDYEAELGFVMGKEASDVSVDEALDYVFGYCNVNDLSVRDLQLRTGQWMLGKTLDHFLPVGPYLVTGDEIEDPQALTIKCWRNGDLCQHSKTTDMIFSVAHIVSHISRYMTLRPGDLVTTGTPEGVIFGSADRNWLQPGDEVVVEIEGLGTLRNIMVDSQ